MAILRFGTYAPDITNYQGETTQTAQNVLPRADGYGPVKAPGQFSLPIISGNDSNTRILLHLNSTFVDSAAGVTPTTWTSVGSVAVNSTVYKFGGGSGFFGSTTSGYLTASTSSVFAVGSSDFKTEFWARPASTTQIFNILGHANTVVGAASTSFFVSRPSSTGGLRFGLSNGTAIQSVTGSTGFTDSTTQTLVTAIKKNNYLYLLRDGVLDADPVSVSSVAAPTPTFNFSIGRVGEVTTSTYCGYLDEVYLKVGNITDPVVSTLVKGATVFNVPSGAYGPGPSAVCRGFFYARNSDGSITLFAGTLNRLYRLDNTTLGWMDVSKDLLNGYSDLPTSYHWQFAQHGNRVIAVQPNVAPQSYTLGTGPQFGDLGGSPPQAAYVAVVNRFLVLTGLLSAPFRIQWSDLGDPTNWTPGGASFAGSQDFADGGIARGVAGGDYGVMFQDTAIRRLTYQQGASYTFIFERVTEDLGLLAPYSIVRSGSNVYFLSNKGFHVINSGNGIPVPIGKEKFDRTFFDDYDKSQLQLVIGAADPESQRVLWGYKSGAGQAGLFDKILVYDTVMDRASTIVGLACEYMGTLAAPGLTLDSLALVYPNIDTMPFSLDDVALAALPKAAVFDSTHTLSLFTGSNLEATIDTPEAALDERRRVRVKAAAPVTDASTCFVSIGARERIQDAVAYSGEQPVNSQGESPQNVSTRLARARVRIPAGATWNFATGVEPKFKQEGRK